MDCDDVAMLDSQIVSDDTVDTGAPIIQVIIGQHDQNGVFSLLSLDKDGVTSEQLE
jgi:hypothetical protein